MELELRNIEMNELNRDLFSHFIRRQVVTECFRKMEGQWVTKENPFVDDWSEEDYEELLYYLKNTVRTGGLLVGSFYDNKLKGFVSVEGNPIGSKGQYYDLSSIHVSEDCRGQGIGKLLFLRAKEYVRERGGKKLYISAHSAVETQAFYRSMGCVEAEEYIAEHVAREPRDCQLECDVILKS